MAQVRNALRSGVGRVVMAVMLLLGLLTVTPMLSGAASAHTAHLEASASCDGTVEWKSHSWERGEDGENDDVRVYRSHDGGSRQEVGHGSYTSENGYEFSGSFTWPEGVSSITVSSSPESEWGNGEYPDDEGDDEVHLERPDCDEDAHVDHELQCDGSAPGYADGSVTLTLSNPAGPFAHDAEFQVYSPDSDDEHETYSVPAGGEEHVQFHGLSEGHHHIKVTKDDDDHSRDIEVDCDEEVPSVTASQACVAGDGAITVNMFNTGGEVVTYTVEDPITHEATEVQVAPNGSESRTFTGLADGEYQVKVYTDDADFSKMFEVDCDDDGDEPHDDECPAEPGDDDHDSSTSSSTKGDDDDDDDDDDHDSSSSSTDGDDDEAGSSSSSSSVKPYGARTNSFVGASSSSSSSTSVKYGSSTSTTQHASSTSEKEYGSSTSDDEHESSTSTSVPDDEDDPCEPPEEGKGMIEVSKACVANDGQVTVTLTTVGGDEAVTFVVEGVEYEVAPGESQDVVLSGLTDGTHTIHVTAGKQDLSFDIDIACDLSPRVTVTQECAAFDGSVHFFLENLGDDADATFTIDGVDHVVAPGGSTNVTIGDLADGTHTFTVSINGVAMPDVEITVDCDPDFDVVAQCNTVTNTGTVTTYWFTVTNTEATDVEVSWDGGTATVPAGESRTIGSTTAPLTLRHGDAVIATAAATDVVCSRTVVVEKNLIGAPPTPETYTVTVSRLVGEAYVEELVFDLVAGTPTTITLPSTLDPAGIQYIVEETGRGTAATSVVTPSELTLSGHLGSNISVVVTNGYSSVSIDKQVSADQIGAGGQLTYTLQGKNTGGLTLDPVVVLDRLPSAVSFVSASVANDGGSCVLTESTRPQLVTCTMVGSLAADETTDVITIVVTVDADVEADTTLVNQAKIVGAYGPGQRSVEPVGSPLSCLPPVAGHVCALSAEVSTTIVGSEPPPPPPPPGPTNPTTTTPGSTTTSVVSGGPTTTTPGGLPRTGGGSPTPLLLIGFGIACIGGSLVLTRRRA